METSSGEESGDGNRFDDAEEHNQEDFGGTSAASEPVEPEGDFAPAAAVEVIAPAAARGKPQAMAVALAAAGAADAKLQLEAEKQAQPLVEAEAMVIAAEPMEAADAQVFTEDVVVQATAVPEADVVAARPKKKRKTPRKSSASGSSKKSSTTKSSGSKASGSKASGTKASASKSSASKSSASKASASKSSTSKASASKTSAPTEVVVTHPSLNDPSEPVTAVEYQNLAHLFEHFCKVPLLAEFSRPVTLLHPELTTAYSKIVSHPIDLGKVCRKIARRQYPSPRELQLDMWRIFANCVKYHSHPSNKEGVPSFVSIALHLREFFNNLFQEWMLPSDPPKKALTVKGGSASVRYLRETYATREEHRKKRLIVSGLTCMSIGCMRKTADKIMKLLNDRGCVDELDTEPLFPRLGETLGGDEDEDGLRDLQIVVTKLGDFSRHLVELADANTEYTVEQFDTHLKACYLTDVFENNSALKFRVRNRINRFLHIILCPINEANCRGVTQSSIWGCMAAAIWARESSKKPFWPALVLGILAPEDQREDWHFALTDRNERRLPEALRTQLATGKRKAEVALKRQSQGHADPQSFFLVEFLGTHEFIWVRETDIVESFEPDDDPNVKLQQSKKKRSGGRVSNAIVGSKKYQSAIEEAGWALEEFEMQLQDACGDLGEDEDGEDGNYSYPVLCVSDDEADEAYIPDDKKRMSVSELEEANELIATRGLIDFSSTGRKNAKKRAQALKKQKQELEKKEKLDKAKKAKAEQSKKKRKESTTAKTKGKEVKKGQKEIDKRRKRRTREREKALKSNRKNKRRRLSLSDGKDSQASKDGNKELLLDKRARATAYCKGYLTRMSKDEEYRSLGLQGIVNIPGALVDSSGLIGMALAFRAAAGEIEMPGESGHKEQRLVPWDTFAVKDTMTPEEKEQALASQAELLDHEIKRIRAITAMRLKLAQQAEDFCERREKEYFADEAIARINPYKKRKKPGESTSKATQDSPAVKSGTPMEVASSHGGDAERKDAGPDAEMKDAKEEAAVDENEATIGLGPSHLTSSPPRVNPKVEGKEQSEDAPSPVSKEQEKSVDENSS